MFLGSISQDRLVSFEVPSDHGAWVRGGIPIEGGTARSRSRISGVHHIGEFGVNIQDVGGCTVTRRRWICCGYGGIGGPDGASFRVVNVVVHDNPGRQAYPVYTQYDGRAVPIRVLVRRTVIAGGYGSA